MNINSSSSSTYTNEAYSSNGFSGMMSGLDTESLVKSMLSSIQNKIDQQNQEKQKLQWKQEIYRDVITKVQSFQSKYFDLTSSTSLRTNAFFNQMTTTSSNSLVKIAATNSSMARDFTVQTAQLARAASLKSGKVSSGEISLNFDSAFFDTPKQELKISAGGAETSINLLDYSSVEEIADAINASGSSVTASVDEGKLVLDGGETEFSVSGTSNALSTLGISSGTVSKNDDDKYVATSSGEVDLSKLSSEPRSQAELQVSLNGIKKTIVIKNDGSDPLESFRSQIKKAYGSSVQVSDDGKITTSKGQSFSISGDTEVFGLDKAASTTLLTSAILEESGIPGLTADAEGKYNITINGESFTFEGTDTINTVMSKINSSDAGVTLSYNSLSDAFEMVSNSTGAGFELNVSGNLGDAMFGGATFTEGRNAVVNINGQTVERTENTFAYNGVTIELKGVTGTYEKNADGSFAENADGSLVAAAGTVDNAAKIESSRNVDSIVDTIKSFVNDYNSLIKELNDYTHAEANDYDPLTDAQKAEMSEKEIEKWEAKAKEGLLRNDKDISNFLQSMRTVLYSKAGDSGLSLSQFGINSSSDWKEYGKLEIDEEALKNALNTDFEKVRDTFAGENGIAAKLNSACKAAANSSSATPGSLVSLAGIKGKASEKNNVIQTRLDNIADKLSRLQDVYNMRKNRYWKSFNSMETALSNMNSTSSYLTQMLGG